MSRITFGANSTDSHFDVTKKKGALANFETGVIPYTSPPIVRNAKLHAGKMAVISTSDPVFMTNAGDSVCTDASYKIGIHNTDDVVVVFTAVEATPGAQGYVRTKNKIGPVCLADSRVVDAFKKELLKLATSNAPQSLTNQQGPTQGKQSESLKKVKKRASGTFEEFPK